MPELVINAVREPKGPLIVVLTLRADFYDRPLRYREFGELMKSQQENLLPMSIDDLREVIEGPVRLPDVGVSFEKDLVGDLLFEMRGRPEALPLLQFTLTQLFERRDGLWMTRKAYEAIDGVSGAQDSNRCSRLDTSQQKPRALVSRNEIRRGASLASS